MSFSTLQTRVNATALKRLGAGGAITLAGNPVTADFCEAYTQAHFDGLAAESRSPQLTLASAEVPGGVRGQTVIVNSTSYTVTSHKPDGFGLSTLTLELA